MAVVVQGAPGVLSLAGQGVRLPVVVQGPSGQRVTTAEIDTGSSMSSVDRSLLVGVGATQSGVVPVSDVQGQTTLPIFAGAAVLTAQGLALTAGLPGLIGDVLPAPVQVLIGRDVLALYDFQYDGATGRWWLTGPASVPSGGLGAGATVLLAASLVAGMGGLAVAAWSLLEERDVLRRIGRRGAA